MCSKKENSRWLHRQLQWKWFCFPLYILHHWHCYELSLLTLEWMWMQLPSPEWMGVRICNSVPELPAQSLEWKPGHLPALWEILEKGRTHKVGTSFNAGRRFKDAGLTKIEWQKPHGSIIVMLLWSIWEWVLVNRIIAFSQKPYEVTFYHIIYQSSRVAFWG